MSRVPEWVGQIYTGSEDPPAEADAPVAEEIQPRGLLRGETKGGTPASATLATARDVPEEGKPGKAPMHLRGEFTPSGPQDLQVERELIRQKELNFQEAQSYTRLNTGRALSQTKAMAQEIAMEDHLEMERLNKEHYSRWEAEDAQFREDIDAARQLRVNPNSYFQNVGRSGRVSSVLASAASQMAAGAGNPNLAWQRIQATINQDIATQKANIELEFGGIEAAQGQQDREQANLEKYYSFEEKSRGVAFTALEAQVGVIMQRAANEMEYQGYQMIRDRARAEALDAIAAARAKDATLFLDQPTYTAYQALLNAKKWKEAKALLQAAYQEQEGSAQPVDTTVYSYDQAGNRVAFEDPTAPQAPAPAAGEAGLPVEGPGSPVQATPKPGASRVARKRNVAEAPTSPGESAPEAPSTAVAAPEGDRQPLTPEQAQSERENITEVNFPAPVLTPEEQKVADKEAEEAEADLRRRANAAQVEQGIIKRMGADVMRKGGYRFAELERLNMQPQGFNTFTVARDIILDPTNPEIAVAASYEDARELLKYDTRTGRQANYERKNPELYEDYTFLEHEGTKTKPRWIESNYLETAWGRLKLSRISSLRSDQDKREELQSVINKDFARAQDIHRQAKALRKSGVGSFLGLQISDGGISWPGDEDAAYDLNEKLSGQIGLGIRAMKQLDPSGRLTDKDIEVGIQFMTALQQNPGVKAWDLLTSTYEAVFGKGASNSAVRKSLVRVLAATTLKLSDAIAIEHKGHIVMDYDQDNKFQEERQKIEQWLRSEETE